LGRTVSWEQEARAVAKFLLRQAAPSSAQVPSKTSQEGRPPLQLRQSKSFVFTFPHRNRSRNQEATNSPTVQHKSTAPRHRRPAIPREKEKRRRGRPRARPVLELGWRLEASPAAASPRSASRGARTTPTCAPPTTTLLLSSLPV
jgi:hypothetical protein